ncbi:hypothetical protein [Eubacterium ramulus]|uniref:hypothetical protein n=1 Tax=Eubacterium ramulus TaxID=39490 RepID=UPI00399BFD0B
MKQINEKVGEAQKYANRQKLLPLLRLKSSKKLKDEIGNSTIINIDLICGGNSK